MSHPCQFKRFDDMWVKIADCGDGKGTCPPVPNVTTVQGHQAMNAAGEPAFLTEIRTALGDNAFSLQAGDVMTVQCGQLSPAGSQSISLSIKRGTATFNATVPVAGADAAGTHS